MLRIAQGSADLFEVLVRRHQGFGLAVAFKYLGEECAAKDAVQAAFIEVLSNAERYSPQGKFRGYFYRVVLNSCRMLRRKDRARLRAVNELKQSVSLARVDAVTDLAWQQSVDRLLRQLPSKYRVVLILRYAGELSLAEIAENLQVPLGTVKSRIFAGLAQLRSMLEDER
jgi:RNA polymerase sigma-70 factor (ECF subfamily)